MTALLEEIDELINLLEADIPASPNSMGNVRRQGKLEREMRSYFKKLDNAFPYHKIDRLYKKYITESLGSETDSVLDPLLASFESDLKFSLNGWMAETYLSGQAEMITWGKTKGGIPIAYEGPPISHAVDWAKQHSATLVTQMGEETKRRLALTISNGINQKRGIPGLARDIRNTFGDMTRYRSQLIARTETAFALSSASLDSMADMGIEGKEWVTVGDSRVSAECQANAAQGVIPVNEPFQSGAMAPPQHPACRCALAPSTALPGKKPAEEG